MLWSQRKCIDVLDALHPDTEVLILGWWLLMIAHSLLMKSNLVKIFLMTLWEFFISNGVVFVAHIVAFGRAREITRLVLHHAKLVPVSSLASIVL